MRQQFPDRTDEQFLQSALAGINELRAKHGVPPLTLDDTLVQYAKSRAALMSTQEGLSHGHAGLDDRYGENASWSASSAEVVGGADTANNGWYSEISDYKFDDPDSSGPGATGHFTQLVWKSSTKVGFGRAFGKGSKWWETYIVANFSPSGNYEGQYKDNVPRPIA